ncbi:MAG: amidohydrolase [Planctomycetes bacterium]|nr:amidohydrolase [Planctomycetota bacterium]
MIVDVHSHFWSKADDLDAMVEEDLRRAGGTAQAIDNLDIVPERHAAGTSGADRVIVFGLRAKNVGMHVDNDRVAGLVAADPGRLIGFMSADPLFDHDPVGEIKRCHLELGMRGIKLGPTYQGVPPDHPRLMEIYAYAERQRLPIIVHQGTTFSLAAPLKYANPILLEDIAYRFPQLVIVIAHMGHPWLGECVSLIRKQPHVYADISALHYRPYQFYQALKMAEEYGADHKLLFGSDYPFTTVAQTAAAILGMNTYAGTHGLPPIAPRVLEGLVNRESLPLLNLA